MSFVLFISIVFILIIVVVSDDDRCGVNFGRCNDLNRGTNCNPWCLKQGFRTGSCSNNGRGNTCTCICRTSEGFFELLTNVTVSDKQQL